MVSSLSQWGHEAPAVPERPSIPVLQGRVIVEVLNGGGREGVAREAIEKAAREILERVAWEVIPDLAERLIREEIERLKAEK